MFLEGLHRRHERSTPIVPELSLQILDAQRFLDVRIIAGVEIVG